MSKDAAGYRGGGSRRRSGFPRGGRSQRRSGVPRGSRSRKAQTMEQLALERERLQQDILLHAQELAAEMNLRMLLDRELGLGEEKIVFYVESVIVTSIIYPVGRRESFFVRIKSILKKHLPISVSSCIQSAGVRDIVHSKCRNKGNRTLKSRDKGRMSLNNSGNGNITNIKKKEGI